MVPPCVNVVMSRVLLITLLALSISYILTLNANEADACSCGRATPEMHMKNADRVFLARIDQTKPVANGYATEMTLLHTFKGKTSKNFRWQRTDIRPLCGPEYETGEVHVVLVSADGSIGLCSGNFGMTNQVGAFFRYAKLAKQKVHALSQASLEEVLTDALKGYTHNRQKIRVHHTPLIGKRGSIHGSTLRYLKTWKSGKGSKGAIIIDQAGFVQSGNQRHIVVTGRYRSEGLRFQMVAVKRGNEKLQILYRDVAER